MKADNSRLQRVGRKRNACLSCSQKLPTYWRWTGPAFRLWMERKRNRKLRKRRTRFFRSSRLVREIALWCQSSCHCACGFSRCELTFSVLLVAKHFISICSVCCKCRTLSICMALDSSSDAGFKKTECLLDVKCFAISRGNTRLQEQHGFSLLLLSIHFWVNLRR